MKFLFLLFGLFVYSASLFSQEIPITVIEKKGKVDLKIRDNDWSSVNIGDIILTGSEFFTGLHSSITLEFGKESYITINQLSQATIDNVRLKKGEINVEVKLNNGYLVLLSKKNETQTNKISVNFEVGNVVFANSGGEVYLRKEEGAIIKSFLGRVTVNPKIKTFYFLDKDEFCGITPGGILLDYDFFLRKEIITKPNEITNKNQIDTYFEILSKPFNSDVGSNDYRESLRP
ncbi:MAG TPA: hypothetical protein PK771_09435 [Spirochaetota bacterium]|nr:hypothetical protein [Spirochaetota bacterium]